MASTTWVCFFRSMANSCFRCLKNNVKRIHKCTNDIMFWFQKHVLFLGVTLFPFMILCVCACVRVWASECAPTWLYQKTMDNITTTMPDIDWIFYRIVFCQHLRTVPSFLMQKVRSAFFYIRQTRLYFYPFFCAGLMSGLRASFDRTLIGVRIAIESRSCPLSDLVSRCRKKKEKLFI